MRVLHTKTAIVAVMASKQHDSNDSGFCSTGKWEF